MHYISYKESLKNNINNKTREKLNKKFIKTKLKEYDKYFDELFNKIDSNIKLDKYQRIAILNDDDFSMIIAGAGSGKTTTMAGKVKYLVDKLHINPNNILVISFTNKAVDELSEKINKDLGINSLILTFHKLGIKILKDKNVNFRILLDFTNEIKEYIFKYFTKNKGIFSKIIYYYKDYFDLEFINNYLYQNSVKGYHKGSIKFVSLCLEIISKIKISSYDVEKLNDILKHYESNEKIKIMIELIIKLYNYYLSIIKENNYIDFEEMINLSYDVLDETLNYKYEYIIIDEFQDISYQRFCLIKKLSDLTSAKIVVVGDDWQSIFAFAGSDISIFTELDKYVGHTEKLKLVNTYRNSQQLIDIAGKFIMRNNKQIKKNLKSPKLLNKPVKIIFYDNNKDYKDKFLKSLEIITKKFPNKLDILLIGRYKKDIEILLKTKCLKEKNNKLVCTQYPKLKFTFLTAHSSKGLGYDNIIIINALDDIYGFPSKIIDSELVKIFNINNDFLNEERRLFYVALTRTKNYAFILVPKDNYSIFIKEIIEYPNVEILKIKNK